MTAALRLPDLQAKQDWTVDDLASLPEGLRYELIDGRLLLPSPTVAHQDICVEILLALRLHCPPDLKPVLDLSLKVNGVYAAAGVAHYWVVDPMFPSGMVLTEFRPGATGQYEIVRSTAEVFETDTPYPVSLDLPGLSAARTALLERAKP